MTLEIDKHGSLCTTTKSCGKLSSHRYLQTRFLQKGARTFLLLLTGISMLAACSSTAPQSAVVQRQAPLKELSVVLQNPPPQTFPTEDASYGQSILSLIEHELTRESALRPAPEGTYTLQVFIEEYKVRRPRSSLLEGGQEYLLATAVISSEQGPLGSTTVRAEGGGGILQMSERARVRHLATKLAEELATAHRFSRYTVPVAQRVAYDWEQVSGESAKASLASPSIRDGETVSGSRDRVSERQDAPAHDSQVQGSQEVQGSRAPSARSGGTQTLRSCTIDQVTQMIAIGLSNEQIRDACD